MFQLFVFFTILTWECLCKIFLKKLYTLSVAVEALRLLCLFLTWKLMLMCLIYVVYFILIAFCFDNNDSITGHIENASDLALSIEDLLLVYKSSKLSPLYNYETHDQCSDVPRLNFQTFLKYWVI